jgi:DnaJ-class molecular chaperone
MTLYDDLGIKKDATPDQIKEAYRALAMKHHPDKGGDSEEFKRISNAYSILSDAEKRTRYDNGEIPDDISKSNSRDAKLVNIILTIFNSIVDSRFDYAHDDIFDMIRETIQHNRDEINLEKQKSRNKIKDYNNILFTMFTQLLEDKIEACNAAMIKMDEALELCDDAILLIDGCEYKTEEVTKTPNYEQLLALYNISPNINR